VPSSADGVVTSSAGGTSIGVLFNNKGATTSSNHVVTTNLTVNAGATLKGTDVLIKTDSRMASVAVADGGGGGFISLDNATATANGTNKSEIKILTDADIEARNNLTVSGNLNSYVSSEAESTSGGFISGGGGTATSTLRFGMKQTIDGDLTAGNAILVENKVDNNSSAKAEAYGGGFGLKTSVSATAEVLTATGFKGAEIILQDDADLLGATVVINSDVVRNRANANTNTTAGGAGGYANAYSTARINSDNAVVLNGGANITGNESILVQAVYSQTNNYAKAKSRLYAIGGSTRANATNEVTNDVKIEGHWEAVLRTADLDVNALDLNISNDRSRSPGGFYIGPARRGGDESTTLTRDIFWEAHVILLGEPNPYLHIDKDGVIRSLSNIEFLGVNDGKTVNQSLGYIDVNNKQVVLDDIIFDQAGDATFWANADANYGSVGRIWGNEGLFESQRSWDYVTIINESEWDLVINHIDAIDGGAVVKVQVDDIKYGRRRHRDAGDARPKQSRYDKCHLRVQAEPALPADRSSDPEHGSRADAAQ